MSTPPAILARLTAIGARIERRGDRLVVRAGRRPVPVALIEEARAAKAELSKALSAIEDAQPRNDEHLRCATAEKLSISADSIEDAHGSASDEHLRAAKQVSAAEDAHPPETMSAAEGAHPPETMSTFDGSEDSCGSQTELRSKMLIPPSLSTLDDDEHLHGSGASATILGEAADSRPAIVEYDDGAVRKSTPSEPALLAPGIWFDRFVPPGEPPFDRPCASRRGQVKREGVALLHFCVVCGTWGAYGYGVFGDRPGRWYCLEHRPSG